MKTILQRSPRQVGTGRDDPTLSPNCQVTWSQKKKKNTLTQRHLVPLPRPDPPRPRHPLGPPGWDALSGSCFGHEWLPALHVLPSAKSSHLPVTHTRKLRL